MLAWAQHLGFSTRQGSEELGAHIGQALTQHTYMSELTVGVGCLP